jgi:hypothetical protein
MTTTVASSRRKLRFESLSEILDECQRLRAGEHRTVGNWSFAQIMDHLAKGIDGVYDGYGFTAPWHFRLAGPVVKRWILTRAMRPGIQLSARAAPLMPADDADLDASQERLRQALERIDREQPRHPHPVFGRLTTEEVRLLTLRHSELHLGFVIPE